MPIKVMFSKDKNRIKKQLLLLRKFLDIEGDKPIEVIDYATMEYENKSFGKKVVEIMLENHRSHQKAVGKSQEIYKNVVGTL